MIARVWRGVVAADRRAEYVAYVDNTGVAEYRQAASCRLSMILTRDLAVASQEREGSAPQAEVIAFSIWDDEAAIAAFAGPDIRAMVLYPEDQDFLLEAPTLDHYRVHSFAFPAHAHPSERGGATTEGAPR